MLHTFGCEKTCNFDVLSFVYLSVGFGAPLLLVTLFQVSLFFMRSFQSVMLISIVLKD